MMLFPATTAVLILATLLTTPAASKEAIEVEAAFDDKRVPARHSDYLSGNHELTSNEAEFFFPRLVEDSKASGGTIEFDALERETGGRAEELASQLVSHTVLETLLVMTSDKAPPRTWVRTSARLDSANRGVGPVPIWIPTGSGVTCACPET